VLSQVPFRHEQSAGPKLMRSPVFSSLAGYRLAWSRGDLLAGLTVWAVLVPESLAYASIAGVSPVVGLYAAPGALLLYAAAGTSRRLIVGPMAATAALSAAAVGSVAAGNSGRFAALTAALAITIGILGVAAGLARLGFVVNFRARPDDHRRPGTPGRAVLPRRHYEPVERSVQQIRRC
jgi:SulP family sulfate permease